MNKQEDTAFIHKKRDGRVRMPSMRKFIVTRKSKISVNKLEPPTPLQKVKVAEWAETSNHAGGLLKCV